MSAEPTSLRDAAQAVFDAFERRGPAPTWSTFTITPSKPLDRLLEDLERALASREQNPMSAAVCALGHTRKAMECPACSGSTDLAHWRWYKSRTSSKRIRAGVQAYLDAQPPITPISSPSE